MDALDKKKAFLIRGDDLARMQRLLAEWETLTVHQTDAQTPSLTRGTLATRLEIPKATAIDADHPFRPHVEDTTHLRFTYGLCNNIVPTVDGTPMNETVGTPPAPPKLEATSTGVAYLETVWAGDEPKTLQSAAVKVAASVPADDDTHGYKLLSSHTVTNGALTDVFPGVTHSLFVERFVCGSAVTYYWTGV